MAFGIIVVTHGKTGISMVEAVQNILGQNSRLAAMGLDWDIDFEDAKRELGEIVTEKNNQEGVLIFTDMFGGTPNNIALGFYKKPGVEIVSGVNLPLLIKALTLPEDTTAEQAGQLLKKEIHKTIYIAGDLLG
ncbi:MAG: PTS sugar transporter subunit IIA [Acidobacteria bacterium]|nr:MAG: PTS sugar transporter subunit IIA [Acidobacteriota bacterium]